MKRSSRTALSYLAALAAAIVLHAGLAVALGGSLRSAARAPGAKAPARQEALTVTFRKPEAVQLEPMATPPVTRLRESVPAPGPAVEQRPREPVPEAPGADASVVDSDEAAVTPTALQPPETAPRWSFTARSPHQQRRDLPALRREKPRPLQPIDAEAVYPLGARLRNEQGAVRLIVHIGADGRLKGLEISASSGFPALDRAAELAVRQTRFAPATRDGRPVADELTITIRFRLES